MLLVNSSRRRRITGKSNLCTHLQHGNIPNNAFLLAQCSGHVCEECQKVVSLPQRSESGRQDVPYAARIVAVRGSTREADKHVPLIASELGRCRDP